MYFANIFVASGLKLAANRCNFFLDRSNFANELYAELRRALSLTIHLNEVLVQGGRDELARAVRQFVVGY